MTLADLRKEYSLAGLSEKDVARDPYRQFEKWFQEAEAAKIHEPNAAILATAARDGRPSARMVLLKAVDGRGFVFYTNYDSRKGRELEANPRAAYLFPWVALERQVIVEGSVAKVAREESEAYFHSRPREPARCLGLRAELDHLGARRARRGHEGGREEVLRRRGAAAPALGRIPDPSRLGGILAGPAQPAP